jgi:hypothetical protein
VTTSEEKDAIFDLSTVRDPTEWLLEASDWVDHPDASEPVEELGAWVDQAEKGARRATMPWPERKADAEFRATLRHRARFERAVGLDVDRPKAELDRLWRQTSAA